MAGTQRRAWVAFIKVLRGRGGGGPRDTCCDASSTELRVGSSGEDGGDNIFLTCEDHVRSSIWKR